jgi:Protein of unknown function (DUF3306)
MTMKREPPALERFSLRRWSQRKLAVAPKPAVSPASASVPPADAARPAIAEAAPASAGAPQQLPSVDSLTFDSEFTPFLRPGVDETIKRAALKKLLRDPRFNVMDGLDTYIDDYTKADPISADMLKQLVQARYIFDPPKTEVTAEGHVIDSPVDDAPHETPEVLAVPADPADPDPHPANAAAGNAAPDGDKR